MSIILFCYSFFKYVCISVESKNNSINKYIHVSDSRLFFYTAYLKQQTNTYAPKYSQNKLANTSLYAGFKLSLRLCNDLFVLETIISGKLVNIIIFTRNQYTSQR